MQSKYLIIGSSHTALEAATAIRIIDTGGTLTLLTRDAHLPYSPTILPYVVSGRAQPDNVTLRDAGYFRANSIVFVPGADVASVDPTQLTVRLASGEIWQYERLLIATGAAPSLPSVRGLNDVRFHVLRSLDDAVALRQAMQRAKSALVLGAGLIGMHAAENMAKAGIKVSVVELQPFALSAYFQPKASAIIERAFTEHGVRMLMGRTFASIARAGEGIAAKLDDGTTVDADLLLVCTGVRPNIGFLNGSGVETDAGILVDDRMRTNVANVWAAGDVAQAHGFWGDKVVNGILPNAVEQGRTAGADMANDAGVQPFPGAVPLNTYSFFGQQAISVGHSGGPGSEVTEAGSDGGYRHIVLKDGRLVGISTINDFVDAGIMWQLILRRTDLSAVKEQFIANPQLTGRQLMSQHWR
ncbi:MAG TPA: NAD(P)/FAD-dependent oxidoreductase [Pseudolabrys sp.]|nr:NAD(P)/FAD-dependent oxidoreductase [Pseudolabrys sp.]